MNERKPKPAKSKFELREPARPLQSPEPRELPSDHPAAEIFRLAAQVPTPESDRSSTLVPDRSGTLVPDRPQPIPAVPVIKESEYSGTRVPEHQSTLVPESRYYKKPNATADKLDRILSPAESKVYEHLWRMTVGFGTDRVQIRVSTLCKRTGYRSMKTVRVALFGLESKGLVRKVSRNNDPLGDEYVMLDSGTRVLEPSSTPVENALVLESKSTQHLNTNIKEQKDDDEAFAGLLRRLRQASREVTGRETSPAEAERWNDVAEILATELQLAASRTTVSSAPAFLAEHLRRRLRKADARQIEREVSEATAGVSAAPATAKPELTGDQLQEQANLMTGLLRDGATIQELEEQFAGNFRAAQWHQVRSIALAQHGFSKTRAGGRESSDVLEIDDAPPTS